ncbi:MAG: hypothetical protein H0T89_01035 [Deltaproteobacteria bacterium]|nr:hypothetical protein [Deltaproteobacteria bacterium]
MIDAGELDPLGFVTDDLAARGALVETGEGHALVVLPAAVAAELGIPEAIALATDAREGYIGCGLGAPLLDGLIASVRATVPVASVTWQAEPPKLAVAERLAERVVVRNGVADVLGIAHGSATYVAGVFAWAAEADDRYEGLTLVAAHAGTTSEPDGEVMAAITRLIAGHDPRVIDEREARGATGAATVIARRAGEAIGPRLDEVGVAVARRRDRERDRIDEYFRSLVGEAQRPRRQVAREAIEARVAALRAEHASKLRDLASRYTLRVRLEPVALVAIAMRVAEVRLRLRRRKGERELALHVPPGARSPDALACVACASTTRAPLLCDDALHVLCESCAPDPNGRPRCPACRSSKGARSS